MKLHDQVTYLKTKRDATEQEITEKLAYLGGSKFQGPDNNYVNAREMYSFLLNLRSNL